MSKFVDKLQNISKPSAPIGFHPATSKSKGTPMLLIAGLSGVGDWEAVVDSSEVNAGLLLAQDFKIESVKGIIKTIGAIPLGVFMKDMSKEEIAELAGSGCDFVVFDVKTSVASLQGEAIGKFLVVEPSLDQGLVRAINNLDVDGVLINKGEESFISIEHLLICQRFSELLDKPLLAVLPSMVTDAELVSLWQAGVKGIVVPPALSVEAFAELRKVIDNLPRESKRLRSKVNVVLPHYGSMAAEEEEEEEEEE
jgi:hypothetical protein